MPTFTPVNGVPSSLGMCSKCLKWRDYSLGSCPVCQQTFNIEPWLVRDELAAELAQVLLLLQEERDFDLHTPKDSDDPDKQLVRRAMKPTYWYNSNTPELRRTIGQLRGLAAQKGHHFDVATDAGDEITIAIEGVQWRAFKRKRDGHIVPIAPLETVETVADEAPNTERVKHTHGKPVGGWATVIAGCPACEAR